MMKESKIFGDKSLEELRLRMSGRKKNHRLWYVIKPKVVELVAWCDSKKDLERALKDDRENN